MDERASAFAVVDAVAEQFVARAAPIQFGVARTQQEIEAAYHLRYETVIERGWAQPRDFAEERERDEFDEAATHVIARDRSVIVATARLVFPREGHLLPTEKEFDLVIEPRGKVVDWRRFAVAPAYRGRDHRVFAGLLGYAWQQMRARGLSELCGVVNAQLIPLYESMGIKLERLAPARVSWGEERYPIRFDVVNSIRTLAERWNIGAEAVRSDQ